MAKYGKEDVYVTASDGRQVLREMLSEYEKSLLLISPPKNTEKEDKMEEKLEISDNTEVSKISDDSIVINYIMLGRIYDMLVLVADGLGKGEDAAKLIELHKMGQLMSPPPIIVGDNVDEEN